MTRSCWFLRACHTAGAALLAGAVQAQPAVTPDQFAWHQPIETTSAEAIQRFALGADTYAGTARADLGDLRIFNAAGEVVPYALVRREAQSETLTRSTALRFFPVYAHDGGTSENVEIDVKRHANGSLVAVRTTPEKAAVTRLAGYVIDTSGLQAPIAALDLQWPPPADGLALAVDVDTSDDLQHWVPAVQGAQLVELRMGDQQLLRNRIELDGVQARYLRLRWSGGAAFTLSKLVAQTQTTQTRGAAVQWTAPIGARAGEAPGEYLFDAPGVPVQALRLTLPQQNTVAPLQVFRRDDPKSPWTLVASTVAFRLQRDGRELVSPELLLARSSAREWKLVVDQRGGGLGQGRPEVALAWVAHQAVFVARGNGPYTLAYGNRAVAPAPFDLATLVPGYRDEQFANLPVARLGAPLRTSTPLPAKPTALKAPAVNARTAALWAVLIMGVLGLGYMAWRLLRQIGPPEDGAAPHSGEPPTR